MSDIFDEAKFGDKFKTRDGRIAIFYSVCEEDDGYNFIIEPSENSVETVGTDFHFVDKNGHWHRCDDVDTENDIVEKFEQMKDSVNLFERAKFGDWYMTSEGYKVRYVGNLENPDIAIVIVPTTGCQKHVALNGHLLCGSCLSEKQFIMGRCESDIDENAIAELGNKENVDCDDPDNSQSYIRWNSMDKEPLMRTVILYSNRENKIYDGIYVGDGRFWVNNLTVDKSNFDCWIQRETFFNESGLRKFLDDSKFKI